VNQAVKNFVALLVPAFALLLMQANAAVTADESVVPDRYIVVYRGGVIPTDADMRSGVAGARIVRRQERLGMATVQTSASNTTLARPRSVTSETDDVMRQLAAQPGVEYVLHDRIVTGHRLRIRPSTPASGDVFSVAIGASAFDTFYNSPQGWAVRQAGGYGRNVPGGPTVGPWDTTTGKGIRIAVLDSGVDTTHPDIAPNLILNMTEVDKNALPSMCDDGSPQDQSGHGTWTASLAAGALGPGTGRVIGVAPSASIMNIKVLERVPAAITGGTDTARCIAGESAGLLSWVLAGINDAIANNAQIISMSLGATIDLATGDGSGVKATFDRVTYAALQAGAVLVAAAGNDGYNLANPRYVEIPAQARGVLAVIASTNPDCAEDTRSAAVCISGPISITYYSNYGSPLNAISAPGGSSPEGGDTAVSGWVRGACSMGVPNTQDGLPNDSAHSFGCFNAGHAAYVQAIGTSASAPLVAGAAALLLAAHPEWNAQTVVDALRNTASPATAILPAPHINLPAALLYR
jgi:subtilisin family serine protease